LSKLSQLKQEAYQAGKKRNWDLAVSIYEQILDLDKNNPMVINEMGDLCLKAGETPRAVRHFLGAASRYRTTGLLNNAVAIYKKILRYDADNQSAHWYLAETRASQGLLVEGEEHAIRFLENSERVSGDIKEIFLKRCGQLFELYGTSKPILDKLLLIFRMWDMQLESGRTSCLLACFLWDAGEEEEARAELQEIATKFPEVCNYPEFGRLSAKVDPGAAARSNSSVDVNSISFDAPEPPAASVPEVPEAVEVEETIPADPVVAPVEVPEPAVTAAPEPAEIPEIEIADETAPADDSPLAGPPTGTETSFADVSLDSGEYEIPDENLEKDETGCFDLSLDDEGASFEDLVAEAASGLTLGTEPEEENFEPEVAIDGDNDEVEETAPAPQNVDLLAQILAEDDGSLSRSEDSQLEAITEDIGSQVGGAEGDQDPASLYEMGLVYLDMGMFDQASDSFGKAAEDSEYTARSCEMQGITLLKAERPDDAIEALNQGLASTVQGSKENLGLKYHLGQAYEQAGRDDEAIVLYQSIQGEDSHFLDVNERLAILSEV
jgi:tetratricopeptide (TPR) repeat protein